MIRFLLGMVGVSAAISFGIHAAFSAEEAADLASFPIEGKWAQACWDQSNDSETAYSSQATMEFQGGRYVIAVSAYHSKNCASEKIAESKMEGSYVLGSSAMPETGAYEFDITQSRISMVWFGAGVEGANQNRFCGISDWADGVARDAAGTTCDTALQGRTLYTVVLLNDAGELQFGGSTESRDGLTPENRMVRIDNDDRFVRASQ